MEQFGSILLIFAATAALYLFGAFEPVEQRLTAMRAQLLDRAPTGQVAIVEIDAKSIKRLSTWPWPRSYHARALERLHTAGAEIVGFDVDFSSLSDPAGDRAFAKAIERAQPTILPIFQQRASDDPSQEAVVRSRPAELFRSAWVGGVNIFPGRDGVVRDYPAATMIGGHIQPSLATLLAENDDFGDETFQPDWSIDAQRIPRFSFVDLLNGRIPREQIAGKRIIVGATAIELGDRYTIPRFGTVPGVVIQALAADSLLQGRAVTRSGILPGLLGLTLAALALGMSVNRRFFVTFSAQATAVVALILAAPVAVEASWPIALDSAAALFCAFGCIAARVFLEVRRRHRLMALIDAETGLPNGRALEARLTELRNSGAVVCAAGIDRFESIRDAISTEALAEVVCETSKRIESAGGRSVHRIAPDVLAWIEPRGGFSATEIGRLFSEPVLTREGPIDIHLTVGMDDEPIGENVRAKIERSVAAITMARAAGENCHRYQSIDPKARRQLSLMGELRRGMSREEVKVAYQPKLDIQHGTIGHAEALARWHHPQEGVIAPDFFIPLAESTGVVRELTEYVLSQALADCVRLQHTGKQLGVAVNVSAADIGRGDFVGEIRKFIAAANADPSWLTLEVTESAILNSPKKAINALTALREMGIRLSVDDYGTGQSTLSYLKQLPVNELKIDKSFVTSMCHNPADRIMVRSTIDLGHELGMKVVAEGVEDARTLDALHSLGCDFAQGYLIGKAMEFEELADFLCDPVLRVA
jgi:EAL domain-containing protein (putative c-di-GMP-specific phosphodiesterase class I)/CHASE2 domain-containing sensor protein